MNLLNVHLRFDETSSTALPFHPVAQLCCDEVRRATYKSSGKPVVVSRITIPETGTPLVSKRLPVLLQAHQHELLELDHIFVKRKPGRKLPECLYFVEQPDSLSLATVLKYTRKPGNHSDNKNKNFNITCSNSNNHSNSSAIKDNNTATNSSSFSPAQIKILLQNILHSLAWLHGQRQPLGLLNPHTLVFNKQTQQLRPCFFDPLECQPPPFGSTSSSTYTLSSSRILSSSTSSLSFHPSLPYTPESLLWYYPPELLLCERPLFTMESDMWALGCIFGELIHCTPIFSGTDSTDCILKLFSLLGFPEASHVPYIQQNYYNKLKRQLTRRVSTETSFRVSCRNVVGDEGADLLFRMLDFNPLTRITAQEALQHSFLSPKTTTISPLLYPKTSRKLTTTTATMTENGGDNLGNEPAQWENHDNNDAFLEALELVTILNPNLPAQTQSRTPSTTPATTAATTEQTIDVKHAGKRKSANTDHLPVHLDSSSDNDGSNSSSTSKDESESNSVASDVSMNDNMNASASHSCEDTDKNNTNDSNNSTNNKHDNNLDIIGDKSTQRHVHDDTSSCGTEKEEEEQVQLEIQIEKISNMIVTDPEKSGCFYISYTFIDSNNNNNKAKSGTKRINIGQTNSSNNSDRSTSSRHHLVTYTEHYKLSSSNSCSINHHNTLVVPRSSLLNTAMLFCCEVWSVAPHAKHSTAAIQAPALLGSVQVDLSLLLHMPQIDGWYSIYNRGNSSNNSDNNSNGSNSKGQMKIAVTPHPLLCKPAKLSTNNMQTPLSASSRFLTTPNFSVSAATTTIPQTTATPTTSHITPVLSHTKPSQTSATLDPFSSYIHSLINPQSGPTK